MNWKKHFFRILYHLSFNKSKKFKSLYKSYKYSSKNNKIIIIENGVMRTLTSHTYIEGLDVEWKGNNNTIILEFPVRLNNSSICFYHDNNQVKFGENTTGIFKFELSGANNIDIGKNVESFGIKAILHGDNLRIGDDCLFSNDIKIWTDGHSVLDKENLKLLSPLHNDINIGNHVWIGERAVLLKKTNIPSNSIIANSSIVTKAFNAENSIYAGNPAKLVKDNITWSKTPPHSYKGPQSLVAVERERERERELNLLHNIYKSFNRFIKKMKGYKYNEHLIFFTGTIQTCFTR